MAKRPGRTANDDIRIDCALNNSVRNSKHRSSYIAESVVQQEIGRNDQEENKGKERHNSHDTLGG